MLRRHELLIDAAVPVVVGAVIVAGELLHGGRSARLLPVALALAAAAVLSARRAWPAFTLAVSSALVAVLYLRRLRVFSAGDRRHLADPPAAGVLVQSAGGGAVQ